MGRRQQERGCGQ